jgi:hypothetical protein
MMLQGLNLQFDFLYHVAWRFLANICWIPIGDEDFLRDYGVEKEIPSVGLCKLMGKRVGWLELL